VTGDLRALRYRHPTEDDHLSVARLLEAWWDTSRARTALQRLWFRHFGATSWLAEWEDGRLAGVVVGFVSPGRAEDARLLLVAVDPIVRRSGVGRDLVDRFIASARARGASRIETVVWAGDRPAIAFCRALGFAALDGAGATPIYGTPAYPDYDHDGDDMAVLVREVGGPGPSGG